VIFMSMSLRDQLLKAGLVSEQQAKEAERQAGQQQRQRQKQQPKEKRAAVSAAELAARQAQAAKTARDQELARRHNAQSDAKARLAQIDQLIEQHRLPRSPSEERYNFTDGGKIRRIPADAALRARIIHGELAVVRGGGTYELVPVEVAGRIRERDERAVIVWLAAAPQGAAPAAEDPYKGFEVPDDLMW
jgi:uncharacterized protein YaiL (DUF2058 family)